MASSGNSSSSRPGYTRAGGNVLGEGKLPDWTGGDPNALNDLLGFMGDIAPGQQMFPMTDLYNQFQSMPGNIEQASSLYRQMMAPMIQQGLGGIQQNLGANNAMMGGVQDLTGLMPQMLQASATMANNGLNPAISGAQQSLQNVMNPTAYNPLFQNAMNNQINPMVSAQMAARGLAGSGAETNALSQASQDTSDRFAMRQFQEQNMAQNTLGQLGMMGGQLPGQVFGQFAGGLASMAPAIGQGIQNQFAPLQMLGQGMGMYNQSYGDQIAQMQNLYNFTRSPLNALGSFINGVPNISNQQQKGFFSSLFS